MARGVARVCGASYGLALTGVAGPDPQEGHRPGTVFAGVHGPVRTRSVALALPGDRAAVRELAVTSALALLRTELLAEGKA
jgi:nicotinamide-nucleotide amidase